MIVIQATPVPQPTPAGNIFQVVWETKKTEIVLGFITVVISSILVSVFFRQIARTISRWVGRALNRLARAFADRALFRRRLYREYVAVLDEETRKWQSLHGKPLDLGRVYVRVMVTRAPAMLAHADEERVDWQAAWARRRREQEMEPRQALIQFQRLAVVGDPGIGKTTLLRYLAYLYAHGRAADPGQPQPERRRSWGRLSWRGKSKEGLTPLEAGARSGRARRADGRGWLPGHRVPVFIPLKDLAEAGVTDLAAHLPAYFQAHNYPNADRFVQEKLKRGEFIFLLDALDEVDDPQKLPAVVDMVARFARQYSNERHPNWIVVTSRPQSYEACVHALNFRVVEVLEFKPQQVRDFITNWFALTKEPNRGQRLWAIVSRDPQLLDLSGNPLLLTFITEVFDQQDELETHRRIDLFGDIVTVRFQDWDRVRGIRRGFKFTRPRKENFLKQTALELNASTRSLISREELLACVRDFLLADGQYDPDAPDPSHDRTLAERFVWEIAEGSGILHQKAIAAYDFSHKALREYFSALRLCDLRDGLSRLLNHLQGPAPDNWKMVALLYAGRAADAAPLVRAIWEADPTPSHQGLLLAARCLRDAATVTDPRLRADLSDALFAALRQAAPGARDEGVALLRSIAAARLEAYVRRLLDRPTDPAALDLAARLVPEPVSDDLRRQVQARLSEALSAPDEGVRTRAALLLTQVGADEAAIPLLRGLEAEEPEARAQAALGLGRLDRPERSVLEALRRSLRTDPAPEARHAARDGLLLLGCADELGMVRVPAGEFLMGTSPEQRAHLKQRYGWDYEWIGDEMPQRSVDLAEYFIDRTPVTNAQFAAFVEATGYRTTAEQEGGGFVKTAQGWQEMQGADWAHPRGPGSTWGEIPDHPVVLVSWHDGAAYAEWAGKRLPTEPQWEKAARGGLSSDGGDQGEARLWPWGDEWEEGRCNTAGYHAGRPLLTEGEWQTWWDGFDVVQYGPPTTSVGAFPQGASPYGLLDCAGNVWEWTADWYKPCPGTPYESDRYGETYRVLRGGAWLSRPILARVAYRDDVHPEDRNINYGFRCVVEAPAILSS
jgi:sulfatase modifying factor 1